MGKLLFWMSLSNPSIPETAWNEFLNDMAAWLLVAIFLTAILIAALYGWSARRRKIHFYGDVFGWYTPLWWLSLAVPAGIAVYVVGAWQYTQDLSTDVGSSGVSLQIAIVATVVSALLAYLLIAFIPGITPVKFIYRPAPFKGGKKAA